MGNCTGVFGACVGEDNTAIRKVDKDQMAKALSANQRQQQDPSYVAHSFGNNLNGE